MDLPKKYKHQEIETKWESFWETNNVYRWDSSATRENTFAVDTPPPTVSGSLHIGHVFSYTQTDAVVRYNRMIGKSIFYPMGWDDNGLPTERRVQNVFAIQCNPNLPYDASWKPQKATQKSKTVDVARQNFIEACEVLTKEDEKAFERLWRQLGLSVDWELQYETVNSHCQQISQKSFLDLVEKGQVYSTESPAMWDVDFQTAVAQAEVEDKETPGAYHDIEFKLESGKTFVISTTRPELLPACIAVVAHPDDERYQSLFGKKAITPLFHAEVPILPSTHADPEKGSGILMVCTFGDIADVDWWKQSDLPIKQIIGRQGRLLPVDFETDPFLSTNPDSANENYKQLEGLRIKQAQKKIVELLIASSDLKGDPKPITHPVRFYEKGDTPLEYMTTRQWFIKLLDHKEALLKQGDKIDWHPPFMKNRYQNWVEGLNQDWCVSRQRYFGVPFPVWYPITEEGETNFDAPIFASPESCPIDPLTGTPPGYKEETRNKPGGFTGDTDVMDTWATSSLTPQLMSHWPENLDRHSKVFPMDLRPQSHEIIRTWAFYTITKAYMHHNDIPWKNVAISGWVLDPDRKKMSKSKGNVVTPNHLLEEHSSDAVRYWSLKARLGTDTSFDETVFSIGKKLCTKLFNASKFCLMQLQDVDNLSLEEIVEPIDKAFIEELRQLITLSTNAFDKLEYAVVLENTESMFWRFCDHYIEFVKVRAYREENLVKRRSALATLQLSLNLFLRLFAPFLPYVTEEIWSWHYAKNEKESIHIARWPSVTELAAIQMPETDQLFDYMMEIMSNIRGAKSTAQKNMKHPVKSVTLICSAEDAKRVDYLWEDIYRAGSVASHDIIEAKSNSPIEVSVVLD